MAMTDEERQELERLKKEAIEFQKQAMEWQQRAYKAERELEWARQGIAIKSPPPSQKPQFDQDDCAEPSHD